MTTKRQIIDLALDAIGLGPYAYDATPDDYASGLARLNALMAEWGIGGIGTGFPVTGNPDDGEIDADSGISPALVRGVSAYLACDMAPSYGKQVSPETKVTAEQGRKAAIKASLIVPTRKFDNMAVPAGAGHRGSFDTVFPSDRDNEVTR